MEGACRLGIEGHHTCNETQTQFLMETMERETLHATLNASVCPKPNCVKGCGTTKTEHTFASALKGC